MKKPGSVFALLILFILGITAGALAAKKGADKADWQGATPEEAMERLLIAAESLLDEDDTWQEIHLGRVLYTAGSKARAEAIFARHSSGKSDAGDLVRIARAYAHAGDWEKAKPLYDRVLEKSPKDEDWLAEAGAFYNLNGDRATAESLFERSFQEAPKNFGNILAAAGSYVGVTPRQR